MKFDINPFSLEELDKLFNKRLQRDVDYVFEWTKRAVYWYEREKSRLIRLQELSKDQPCSKSKTSEVS